MCRVGVVSLYGVKTNWRWAYSSHWLWCHSSRTDMWHDLEFGDLKKQKYFGRNFSDLISREEFSCDWINVREKMLGFLNDGLWSLRNLSMIHGESVWLTWTLRRGWLNDSNDDKIYSSSTIGQETVWRLSISSLSEESHFKLFTLSLEQDGLYIVCKIGVTSHFGSSAKLSMATSMKYTI